MEQARLEVIKQKLESELVGAPEGTLRITKSNGYSQYYHHLSDSIQINGKYLPGTEETLIKGLAQKSYDKKVLRLVERRLKQLEQITKEYQDDEIEEIFQKQAMERKNLVNPVEPIKEQIINTWINEEYTCKGFKDEDVLIYSEKGERVRSKTEKIIADYLYRNNILDDPVYASNAVKKIKMYETNGIFVGERLILTFETQKIVLNTSEIERIVERFSLSAR